jgi:hypothetical protein
MSRLEPAHIFEVLNQHGVDYVAIGGVAAIAHGVPRATLDTDVVVAPAPPENHVRLAEALAELDAPTIAQDLMGFIDVDTSDPVDLARGQLIRVPTRWGDLDLVNRAPGAPRPLRAVHRPPATGSRSRCCRRP